MDMYLPKTNTLGLSVDMLPPQTKMIITDTTRASIRSFGSHVKNLLLSQWGGRAIIGDCAVFLDEDPASFLTLNLFPLNKYFPGWSI